MGVAGCFRPARRGDYRSQQAGGRRAAAASSAARHRGRAAAPAPVPAASRTSRAHRRWKTTAPEFHEAVTRVAAREHVFRRGRFQESGDWYEQALKIGRRDVNVSTDLGIAYYYMNLPDQALSPVRRIVAIDSSHAKARSSTSASSGR